MVKITIKVEKYPTEDEEKILTAIENIFDINREEIKKINKNEKTVYEYNSNDLNTLNKFKNKIRQRGIQTHIRAFLQQNILANKTYIYLNKQTATVGKVNLCETPFECPLGAILLEIEEENLTKLQDIIHWLTT